MKRKEIGSNDLASPKKRKKIDKKTQNNYKRKKKKILKSKTLKSINP